MLTIEQVKDLIAKCEKALHEPRDKDHPETMKIKAQLSRLKSSLDDMINQSNNKKGCAQ
jgi:hypothetical protein